MAESNPDALKHLYGKDLLDRMARALHAAHPEFDTKSFRALMPKLEPLEMKPRVRLLREELRRRLPEDYRKALKILLKSARSGELDGFDLWPYSDFVQTYGLDECELSLEALKELTPRFSSEFAVRPYLIRYPDQTLRYLELCAHDSSVDVRRWASEGSRPRLPWGERLQEFVRDPSPTIRILELLKFDSELYVRKSVSNHLNDIAKDHPDRVVRLLKEWKKSAGSEHENKIRWIIHRALRTLIKSGHPGALELIGVASEAKIELSGLKLNAKKLRLGQRMEFGFAVRSKSSQSQKLVIDYLIHFVKANGRTAPKVFKLKTVELPPKAELRIVKAHPLKKITTRVFYPGAHRLEIQINGKVVAGLPWELAI